MNEQLWAPWRIGYITGADGSKQPQAAPANLCWEPNADKDCFICRAVADRAPDADKTNLVVSRTSLAIAVLNRYPYNNGHLLIAPRDHVAKIQDLASEDHLALMELISQSCNIFERTMKAEGFNVGLNLGHVGGAGVPGHLHWHVLPRWNGDTNFMPVLNGTNVISQALEAAWDLLQREFAHTSE